MGAKEKRNRGLKRKGDGTSALDADTRDGLVVGAKIMGGAFRKRRKKRSHPGGSGDSEYRRRKKGEREN